MNTLKITGLSFVLLVIVFNLTAQPASCGYNYRKRITFDPTKVAGATDLSNFPALINIASDNDLRTTSNSGHVQSSSGYDIIFTADDGVTLLDFQLEAYTASSGQLTAWVKIPNLSTSLSTNIYMYYGNSSVSTDQSSTNVWANYYAVWHFQGNSVNDNSGNGQTATNYSTTNQGSAAINNGRAANGNQWMEMAAFPDLTTNFSMSAWVYTSNNSRGGQRVFCDDEGVTGGGYALSIADGSTGNVRFFSRASNPVILDSPGGLLANNTWYYVTAVANISASSKTIFVNGTAVASGTFANAWGTDTGKASIAGEVATGETGNRLQGRIDEVRVAKTALSADWIATEYNNQSSPSTFYTIAAEPNVFTGLTSSTWSVTSNWSSGSVPAANSDIIISSPSSCIYNSSSSIQLKSLWIRPSSTLNVSSSATVSISYDMLNCGNYAPSGLLSGLAFNGGTASIAQQHLSGPGYTYIGNFVINNTHTLNPVVVLGNTVSVFAGMHLYSGVLRTTSTSYPMVGYFGSTTGGSANSYIEGPVEKNILSSSSYVFQVGKGGKWRRVAVSGLSNASTIRAEYFDSGYSNTVSVSPPLNNVSTGEYWQVDRLSGTGNANMSLYWESASASGISNCPALTVARWNGSSWVEESANTSTSSVCSGSGSGVVTTTALVTSFGAFTFGSRSNLNPLPVELVDFNGQCNNGQADFAWRTATEQQSQYFSIEYSANGVEWQEMKRIPAAGYSRDEKNYACHITDAPEGYYRLSEQDLDAGAEIFKTLYLHCKPHGKNRYDVFPNPSRGSVYLNFQLIQPLQDVRIDIVDQSGRVMFSRTQAIEHGGSMIELHPELPKGMYILCVKDPAGELKPSKLFVE